ncbi:TIP41-domain-containing protein [Ascodesmis nigricans]|uniref:TIP41-domain-containing protein n=1 Tax=Ascodesmis nigricans TaxID=341454 RepID=A0A4S2MZT5_9PEZI|nr:TIP41-domain-containing protein [Ascodesmis nigricans]
MTTFIAPSTVRNAGKTLTHKSWCISTSKLPISNSGEIDAMTSALSLTPPEMIFGHNSISLHHLPSGFRILFNSFDALDLVDKTGETGLLKVSYSEQWQRMRDKVAELKDVKDSVKAFDWTYSTTYRGTVILSPAAAELVEKHGYRHVVAEGLDASGDGFTVDEKAEIPFDKLRRPDPILLFDEVMLYEDELADNGIAMLSVKVRVMEERLLVLMRFFLRLDDVVVRIRDTRVYVEFATGEVVREYVAREAKYADVKKGFAMYPADEIPALMRDPQNLVERLPVVETIREKIVKS